MAALIRVQLVQAVSVSVFLRIHLPFELMAMKARDHLPAPTVHVASVSVLLQVHPPSELISHRKARDHLQTVTLKVGASTTLTFS